jgi:ABC-2 type transport system permease protein
VVITETGGRAPPPDARLRLTFHFDPTRPESRAARLGLDDALQHGAGRVDVVEVHDETTTARGGRYIDFLIPGLVSLNIMGSSMWGIGYAVVLARRNKLLKRLAATPMRRAHYLLSFMLSRMLFLVPEVAAVVAFGWIVFGVAIHGSVLGVGLVSLLGGLAFMGLAMLVAARTDNTEVASGWMNAIQMPMWLLGGAFFSYQRFPEAVHPFIRLLPLTAFNDALRALMNDGAPLWSIWSELLVMALWGAISFALALRVFRWR